ncbi:MAG: imidazole glycerol phosphate synthase subunit HisH [Candidatus Thioglobus sp.]|nr:imidazole glycerol phosphate synthase subunit HisH [Candidatus Thioglobus sp.]
MAQFLLADDKCYLVRGRFGQNTDTADCEGKITQQVAADRVVFPGQGAMGACMAALNQHNLVEVIKTCAEEKPFLGICLGLQLLFEHSDENGGIAGLGIINGNVVKFPANSLKVPHMGWNNVSQTLPHQLWHKIENHSRFYSVHSYFVQTLDENVIAGSTNYGLDFTCAIAKNNIFAVQFHPEKSADDGLQLLTNFVNWQV